MHYRLLSDNPGGDVDEERLRITCAEQRDRSRVADYEQEVSSARAEYALEESQAFQT